MARMAILMGVSVCGVEGVVMVSRLYRNVFQPRLSACLQMGNDALAHPVEEAVPFSRVMDDAGLVEGRAQNGRYRDFPAVAAAHATIVYIGHRVFLERIAADNGRASCREEGVP